MTIWPPNKDSLRRPAYRSLAQSLIDAIEAGEIRPGVRLPTHRALAYDLGVSVQTVSRAYDELSRLGVISGQVGRGSFVRSGRPDTRMPWHRLGGSDDVIDCSMLVPVTGELHSERMSATLATLADDLPGNAILSFRPRATLEAHCEAALGWLARCGIDTRRDQVLPANGNTVAMTTALMTAALPGDLVVSEEIGHHTLKSLTTALGLRLAGLPLDNEGIVPDAFDRACRTGAVKVLFVLPSGLGPTAAMMGGKRRRAIVEIARQHDVWIVENDALGPIQPGRPEPLFMLAPERTFYFTGLAKCLLPGLRIAWLVVPDTMVAAARTRHLVTNWMATPLMAEIATRWLDDGTAETLLQWQQAQLSRRNDIAARLLRGLPYTGSPNGMHVWMRLPDPWREDMFVAHARNNGVAVAAGSNFAISDDQHHPAVRICLGAGSEEELERGLSVIARLVRSPPEPALLAI
ncbi:PLP-dependent aminotransferase family protein [Microbaculum sp. FT89]|uniref:MocR-like ectoine utilization transcription factor EhuR n=1 Tax=Microbaculum sp. FT89 TaxID=3447298 RepID=UPI003F532442